MPKKRATPEKREMVILMKKQGFSNVKIGKALHLAESGVRYILSNYAPGDTQTRARTGRPPKMSKRCAFPFKPIVKPALQSHRYKRRLLALNYKKPFMTASQLIEKLHSDTLKALSDRPPGAVVQVLSDVSSCAALTTDSFVSFRSHSNRA
jgi:hypothetical protein